MKWSHTPSPSTVQILWKWHHCQRSQLITSLKQLQHFEKRISIWFTGGGSDEEDDDQGKFQNVLFWEFIASFHIYTIYICLYTFLHNKTWDKWSKENMSQKHLYVKVYYSTILKTELWNNHNCKQMITLKMWLYAIQQKLFFQERTKKLHYSQKIQCNCRY